MLLRAHRRHHRHRAARPHQAVEGAGRRIAPTPAPSARAIVGRVAAQPAAAAEVALETLEALRGDAYNAVVLVRDEGDVRRDVDDVARALRAGAALPLAGLPFTVKDTLEVAGMPARAGSRLVEGAGAAVDAGIVARLRAAGAIPVGRSNCAEFALAPVAGGALYGTTVNPRAAALTTGGSSCGCAAAVAAGHVPLGMGTDYGGSVRFPAACTGIVGMRPAAGSVPSEGQVPAPPPRSPRARLSLPGPLVRSVDDLALVLPALTGEPLRPGALPRRCGLLRDAGRDPIQPAVAATLDSAAASLASQGVDVDVWPEGLVDECEQVYAAIRASDTLDDLRALSRGREHLLSAAMRHALGASRRGGGATAAWRQRSRLVARVARRMRAAPVLVLPVAGDPPPPALDAESVDADGVTRLFRLLAPSRAITLLGLAAVAVPCGASAVQVVAAAGREADALAVARLIEET